MGYEIERKFLVRGETWKEGAFGMRYRQGYLSTDKGRTVRVRLAGEQGFLTVKGLSHGCGRAEYEYPIPADDAEEMLDTMCLRPLVEKVRWRVSHGGHVWEVDEFRGENQGLVLAEIELTTPDEAFTLPTWVTEEVTDDPRYYNANLVARPYRTWSSPPA